MNPFELDVNLFSLISMLAAACWQQLGKKPDPASGEVVLDLDGAQKSIDMLLMLQGKMRGNLTDTEAKLLEDTISSLQANYAEEAAKDSAE